MNVVTLLPSATEVVCALGVDPVAVSHECDHPPRAESLPAVERSRIDTDADSQEITEQVAAADDVYAVDREALAAADPDLIVTQGVCDVCAVDEVLVREAVTDLGLDAEILTTDPHSLADVFEDIERIGAALGRETAAADLLADLRTRVERVAERVGDPSADERPRALVLDWLAPPMVGGHWVPGLVGRAGGRYGLVDDGARSRPHEWADVRAFDPEVLVAAPCGFGVERTLSEAAALTGRPGYADLAAVRDDRAHVVDGNHLLNRPGPRLVDSLEVLAALLWPDRFQRTELDRPEPAVAPLPAPAHH